MNKITEETQLSEIADKVLEIARTHKACYHGLYRFRQAAHKGRTVRSWSKTGPADAEWLATQCDTSGLPGLAETLEKLGCGRSYWLNGKRHREDGPAAEYAGGTKEWWLNGKLHREDGPAIECASGTKEWYLDGKRHRKDGPAVEHASGTKEWYLDDKLHREDGPSIECANGTKS